MRNDDMGMLSSLGGFSPQEVYSYYASTYEYPEARTIGYVTGTTTNINGGWQYMKYEPPPGDVEIKWHDDILDVPSMRFAPVTERCRYCNVKHKHDDKFCDGCGAPL